MPGTLTVASTPSVLVPRVVARIGLSGAIDTTTALGDAYSGTTVRGVASVDGNQFWLTGSSGGVRYATPLGSTTSTQMNSALPTNLRVPTIDAGQLYVSSASSTFQGVSTVGTGLPNTAGQTITLLAGFPIATGPQPYDYWFADPNTLYVADDRTNGSGGIQKWTFSAGLWSNVYNLAVNATTGNRSLSGVVNAGVATLYSVAAASTGTTLVSVTDTGPGSVFTTFATATTNTAFRGVRVVKPSAVPPPPTFTSYCTPKVNSQGCSPVLAGTGDPRLSGPDDLYVTASNVINFSPGIMFWGTGAANVPFAGGTRCVAAPVFRTPVQNSGGSSWPVVVCTGTYSFHFTHAYMSSFFLTPGTVVHAQFWQRDSGHPDGTGQGLSGGIRFTILP